MEEEKLIVRIGDADIREAAEQDMDAFVALFVKSIREAAGGELTGEVMSRLTADQITLWAYAILHEEVMDGGFVQLIHNGYGPFFFRNPFAKALRLWGLDELASLVKKAGRLYDRHEKELTADCTDEEFMELFEKFPAFDALDDTFVENEEAYTAAVACYLDEHLENFAEIV